MTGKRKYIIIQDKGKEKLMEINKMKGKYFILSPSFSTKKKALRYMKKFKEVV